MRLRLLLAGLVFPLFSGTAMAEDEGRIFAGPRLSTLGVGGELGVHLNDHLALRGSATLFSHDFTETLDGVESEVELDLGAVGGQLDLYPFGGAFFVSAGAFSNLNELFTSAQPASPVEIGDTVYAPAEIGRIEGVGGFNDIAAYVGLGGEWRMGRNWSVVAEGGAYFQGAPEIDLQTSGILSNDPAFIADLEAEARSYTDELDRLEAYPVLSLTLRRRF